MNINEKRDNEKTKYMYIQSTDPRYGSSNHGSPMLDYVKDKSPSFIVDFGCGKNNFVKELRESGINGKGIDFAYEGADIMAPMHNVPLDDNCADFITAFDSLEHLLPEDVDLTFKEMHRIAKPNAEFCFSICYRPSFYLVKGQNLHPTVESEAWWKEKISAVGFPENKKQYIIGRFK